jgi:hypothetical protein
MRISISLSRGYYCSIVGAYSNTPLRIGWDIYHSGQHLAIVRILWAIDL